MSVNTVMGSRTAIDLPDQSKKDTSKERHNLLILVICFLLYFFIMARMTRMARMARTVARMSRWLAH